MRVLIVCSTCFYDRVGTIKKELEAKGFNVNTPNGYNTELADENYDNMTELEYVDFFKDMYWESRNKISNTDIVLVLNYDKTEELKNYIGASTFLEMYEACMQNKKIYVMNPLPNNFLLDELKGFGPTILNGDINNIK